MSFGNRHMAPSPNAYDPPMGSSSADAYNLYPTRPASDPFADRTAATPPSASYPPHLPYDAYDAPLSRDSMADNAWDDGHDDHGIPRGASNYNGLGGAQDKYYAESIQRRSKGNKVKFWIVIVIAVLVIIGVGVGIGVWRATATSSGSSNDSKDESGSTSTSNGNEMQYIQGTAKVVRSVPNDPSQFEKDDRLHQSFFGMCYTPFHAQEPWCGATQANVTEDIQLMSQLTSRIRLYGSACNQSQLVLQAIQDTKVDMTVWLGAWVNDNSTTNEDQQQYVIDAIEKYGTDHIEGITVGNEYLLNAADRVTAAQFVLSQVDAMRSKLAALNLPKQIPVGTGDAGSALSLTIAEGVDFMMSNVHPFFGKLLVQDAAPWVATYVADNNEPLVEQSSNKPTLYTAEVGWPSGSMTPESGVDGGAVAGMTELQTFLDAYVCSANQNQTQYFWFSFSDEPWKEQYGGVEPYWGLVDASKQLKDITVPDCPVA
ncbi:hypothetical protein OIO90_003326 [Microbotryomycetes sp. JL221]|nr:hypothetical protein OIO90_003326 [Microbotryomycetes sp. JL221]